jgi:hypothetical protein
MPTFPLTKDSDTFDLDTAGTVSKGGAAVGTWSTNPTNQIVITKPDGTSIAIDVGWRFNLDNHLTVQAGGGGVFDFCKAANQRPFFKTENAVLHVFPDQNQAFAFQLRGEWDLDAHHDLAFTINGVTSVINGFIQDPRGRFMYHFFDQRDFTRESVLGFVGAWESVTVDGVPSLKFTYKRADRTTDVFELPAAITMNRSINQFMYEYDKNGQRHRLQFVGELRINENFEITYVLDRQVAQSGTEQIASTSFKIAATFKRNDFTGDLELAVKKQDGTPGTTITLGGQFTAILGTTHLVVGFSYTQVRDGAVVSSTFGFNGKLLLKDNGEINWEFQRNATSMSININAHVQVGDARLNGLLNLVSANGKVVGVRVLLGIAF